MLNKGLGVGYVIYLVFTVIVGLCGSLLTIFLSPLAAGGGGSELMGYFNGVNYQDLFGINTLIVKIFGLTFAVASGLCIGKEGVLAHIGSILGHIVFYIPLKCFTYFRNNMDKRDIAAAGQAAGVAAAFGAPIGGALYAYEMTAPAVFWNFELCWKIFFCASISSFTLNILSALYEGKVDEIVNAASIKFGVFVENPYVISDLPFFLIMGVFGGLLGALFVHVNYNI
jgi:chloride channel 7